MLLKSLADLAVVPTDTEKTITQRVYEHLCGLPLDAEFIATDIADAMSLDRRNASAAISFLEKQGFVRSVRASKGKHGGVCFVYVLDDINQTRRTYKTGAKGGSRVRRTPSPRKHRLEVPVSSVTIESDLGPTKEAFDFLSKQLPGYKTDMHHFTTVTNMDARQASGALHHLFMHGVLIKSGRQKYEGHRRAAQVYVLAPSYDYRPGKRRYFGPNRQEPIIKRNPLLPINPSATQLSLSDFLLELASNVSDDRRMCDCTPEDIHAALREAVMRVGATSH